MSEEQDSPNIWNIIKNMFFEAISMLFFLIGIILLCKATQNVVSEIVIDYKECTSVHQPQIRCIDMLVYHRYCICSIKFNITQTIKPNVTIYYETSFDQSGSYYSKDIEQLSGKLSSTPSEDCEPFRYNDDKQPIAPCGALANSMFNDTYSLVQEIDNAYKSRVYVPSIHTGLISEEDKAPYKNPPGNLEQALKNFSKPKNWGQNVWELDKVNPDNNGFQNERFIGWMMTCLNRKPAWRVNHTGEYKDGIPAGIYYWRINYTSLQEGRRRVIISSVNSHINLALFNVGIFLLILGLISFISGVFYNIQTYAQVIQKN